MGGKEEDMILCKHYNIEVVLAMFPYKVGLGAAPSFLWKLGKRARALKV